MPLFKSVEAIFQGILIKTDIDNRFPIELFFSKDSKTSSRIFINFGEIAVDGCAVIDASVKFAEMLHRFADQIEEISAEAIVLEKQFK